MITEDYVSFEIAKLLKEKGFDEATHKFYKAITYLGTEANSICIKSLDGIEEEPFHNSVYGFDFKGEDSGEYACPTLQMTMKWLRGLYDLHIIAYPWRANKEERETHWCCQVYKSFNLLGYEKYTSETPKSYEEACEDAIRYCLENLI